MKEFEEIRDNLLDMLEELDERLEKITDDVKHVREPPEKDFAEQATEMENNEVLDYLGNATRAEIDQIKNAISRIDQGRYGRCSICGQTIDKERLEALPFSSKCIKCAEQAE